MLATLWYPNLNPIGDGSIWPLVIVAAYAILAARRRIPTVIAPIVFAAGAALSDGLFFGGRRFPDADDIVGYYIWILAACCFALHIARFGSGRSLIYGSMVLFVMGWLLTLEEITRLFYLATFTHISWEPYIPVVSSLVWMAIFVPLVVRSAGPYRRAKRIARGLCGSCGYDLRASPTRCPECGEPRPGE